MTAPEALRGVGLTAFGVAAVRAAESARDDALFRDPWSDELVAAGRAAILADDDGPARWERITGLVERFAGRAVAVRWFDDAVTAAVAAGVAQVVDLGAGLDTRAWRLDVLAGREPLARRVVVPGDLAGDWLGALRAAGLDPALPTLWFEEGVLAYLAPADATAVLDTVGAVAVPGSRLLKTAIVPPAVDDATYAELRALVPDGGTASACVTGVDRDNAHRLADRGWRVDSVSHLEVAARLGRPVPTDEAAAVAGSGYVTATRL